MATLSTAARLQHATAQQQQRYQQYRADAIAALGQHGSRVLAGAQLTAVGQAYEGVEKATFGTYLRMLKRYWVPFCLWKAGSSGQPDFTVSGQRAADCADSTLELLLADATCDLNVESQVHQLINALDKLAVMQVGCWVVICWLHMLHMLYTLSPGVFLCDSAGARRSPGVEALARRVPARQQGTGQAGQVIYASAAATSLHSCVPPLG